MDERQEAVRLESEVVQVALRGAVLVAGNGFRDEGLHPHATQTLNPLHGERSGDTVLT